MTDILDSKPDCPGPCLVIRNNHGEKWYEILNWDGRFWVTGWNDDPDAIVEAWEKLPPPEQWKRINLAVKDMNESLDSVIGDFKPF